MKTENGKSIQDRNCLRNRTNQFFEQNPGETKKALIPYP